MSFHKYLCGNEAEVSDAWLISIVCEEFHCLPSQAIEAIEEDVGGLLFQIIDLRSYAKAKEVYDSTPMDKRPKSKAIDRVSEITMGIAREKIDAARKDLE